MRLLTRCNLLFLPQCFHQRIPSLPSTRLRHPSDFSNPERRSFGFSSSFQRVCLASLVCHGPVDPVFLQGLEER